jgi:hypothetical protein
MSLLEWLGESYTPGPIGDVEIGGRRRARQRARWGVVACFVVAAALLTAWAYVVLYVWQVRSWEWLAVNAGVTLAYLLLGYWVHPAPDMENLGLLGGAFDHPFRYSDDLNRQLLFLLMVLWPGRFIAESIVDSFVLCRFAMKSGRW